ncbi:MAG: GIY-YIG nuclease family protein [Polycyclovorans sp.]|nr:GIY-YIG nuclease family protein [Polycyclovorans sp.]
MSYDVYLLASKRNGTLYVGVTNDLVRRVWEHRIWPRRWVHQALWNPSAGRVRSGHSPRETDREMESQLEA